MNVLKPQQQGTVFTLLERKKSQREIHRLTGIDRKTIRKYEELYRAQAAGGSNSPGVATGSGEAPGQIPPPRPPAPEAASDAPIEAYPALARSACEPYRVWIEEQVRLQRNATAIYQDLVDRFGFSARCNSVKRFVRTLRRVDPEQFDRLEFAPGEEAQVDYGEGAPTRDPKTGLYRKPRLFIMTLRYSRRSFRRVIWKSSQQSWARLHEEITEELGKKEEDLQASKKLLDQRESQLNRLRDECINRGVAHVKKGQYDQAISDFTMALEINPK